MPALSALLGDMRAARDVLTDRALARRMAERAPHNGGGEEGRRFAGAAVAFSRGLAQIERWGIVVRDIDSGICDFRARREGREVYLCWCLGEERITHWHELDAGFRGRRPLGDAG